MSALVAIFCTLTVAAGWYYASNTTAADRLAAVEPPGQNRLRRRLRKANGLVLLCLAGAFFWGTWELQRRTAPTRFVVAWTLVLVLLAATLGLAVVDVWLTGRLRRRKDGTPPP